MTNSLKKVYLAEICRDFDHHTKEKLRVILGNTFPSVQFGFSAYSGQDTDLRYWLTVEGKVGQILAPKIYIAAMAIIATVKSYH